MFFLTLIIYLIYIYVFCFRVKNWALKFGVDLWEFGRQITNMNEIQRKYRERESKVRRKDGLLLIRDLAAEVKNMMDIKMNSVLKLPKSKNCI
ncbi:voltage-dependent calcium channel subunit alpha-2/delta-3 isoform X3 [Aphis craccivora]|uniref:Voltage-dependent calcium channel subunit alpha-2/delta-3 isoform X3 n=1 Tax=Aphis craccivora TaxID=307492 RepID=A0A6G0Z2X1_APHCR|nr:voltage-dependent calcium channel subunit alpha-2/delta-3 isoform X3 [Aphis craccivora]